MKVLLIGATGNLGLRLIPSLLTHSHTVVAFVRSSSKLQSQLPPSISGRINVVQGSALDAAAIQAAILDNNCDAVINTAGLAAVAPWGKTDLPEIFSAVVNGIVEASEERQKPIRAWFLGGMGVLNFPGTSSMLSNHVPIYLAHRDNLALLRSLPQDSKIYWSVLCPNTMTPSTTSAQFTIPTPELEVQLLAKAGEPPAWRNSWFSHVPLIGKAVVCAINAPRYATTLEQNADFIAADLDIGIDGSEWMGNAVGIIDPRK